MVGRFGRRFRKVALVFFARTWDKLVLVIEQGSWTLIQEWLTTSSKSTSQLNMRGLINDHGRKKLHYRKKVEVLPAWTLLMKRCAGAIVNYQAP